MTPDESIAIVRALAASDPFFDNDMGELVCALCGGDWAHEANCLVERAKRCVEIWENEL